ncbi:MAG TPA: hypothetical protein VFI91_06160 [Longimicrobiaceae bacterium]|nr:hypothetical protein [Longimicrobiaceae bacterium]
MGRLPLMVLLLLIAVGVSGCELVGDVLEFGFWVILIVIILIIALLVWIFKKLF